MGSSGLSTRREFIKQCILGAAATVASERKVWGDSATSRVALVQGESRADNAFRAMQLLKKEIASAIGTKRIIVKPNGVSETGGLPNTHVDWLEGVLEFLKSIGRTDVTIAESNWVGATLRAFSSSGYFSLQNKYPVKLLDLNQEGFELRPMWKDYNTTWTLRVSRLYLDPDTFIISCPLLKTHLAVVATLSVKNVAMSAPIVDIGLYPGSNMSSPAQAFQPGARSNKYGAGTGAPGMHGEPSSYQTLNDNIYRMIKVHGIRPRLSLIDGYQGMEGNGPLYGSAVTPQKLGIASLDCVAADRVCLALMGLDGWWMDSANPSLGPYPAYLSYLGQAGVGVWDLDRIVDAQTGAPIRNSIAGKAIGYAASPWTSYNFGLRTYPRE